MLRALFISAVILLSSVMVQAQTIIYLPNDVGGGPAIIQDESDPAPPGYTAAADQDCAQEVIDNDPFCLDTEWDFICQDAYDLCVTGPTCTDGIQNGEETGIDCGGPDCPPCPTCEDGILNGNETGIDCGGPDCPPCADCPGDFLIFLPDVIGDGPAVIVCDGDPAPDGYTAAGDQECALIVVTDDPFCLENNWDFICQDAYDFCSVEPTCDDGVQNGDETGIDCGGPDCPPCPTCDDGILNGNETGIDCGGPDCPPCPECPGESSIYLPDVVGAGPALIVCDGDPAPDGYTEAEDQDCAQFVVDEDPFCLETSWDGLCQTAYDQCVTGPTCDDGIQNGEETGIDCGGPDCPACPTCDDGIQNGNETGIDCGGPDCPPCNECPGDFLIYLPDVVGAGPAVFVCDGDPAPADYTAAGDQDCALEVVTNDPFCLETSWDGICNDAYIACAGAPPTCEDGIQNGEETGVDCGGPDCPSCDFVLISDELDLATCSGAVYDSGGSSGDYQDDENYTMTICSEDSIECIALEFFFFDVEGFFDNLFIYEGTEAVGTPILTLTGEIAPTTYEFPSGCITLNFQSDFSIPSAGFAFNILCGECPVPTEQDCLGANVVCNEVYVQEDYPPEPGNFPTTLPAGTCLDNAQNVIWYTFTVQESGLLSFVLTPEVAEDDYDWGLFDLSDASCADIANDLSLLVSCNSYGEFGVNGPTGISTANGGTGNVNGPGNLNGPPFNADYPVTAGQTFALLVQNWTGSNDGYTLDFSESTAELFEPLGPDLEDVDFINCGNLIVTFETSVDCATLDVGDFLIESDDQVYTVDSILSDCDPETVVDMVELFISPSFPDVPDSISISFNPGTGVVQDLCGNPVPTDTVYDFVTPQWIVVETSVVNTICDFPLGSIEIVDIVGGVPPYIVSFEGIVTPDTLFTELLAGTYTIEVTDDIGCHSLQQVEVVSEFVNSELDTVIFENCGSVILEFSELVDCSTITPDGITISSSSQVFNVVSIEDDCTDGAGQTFELSISPLFPDFPDTVNISFGSSILDLCGDEVPVEASYEFITPQWITIATDIEKTECLSDVGSVELVEVFGADEPFIITFEGEPADEGFFIDQLGLGAYAIEITDVNGCHLLQNAFVTTDSTDVDVLIPNVFTPNGDDVNPLFGPFSIQRSDEVNLGLVEVGTYFDVYELQVFNRWGRLVFESGTTKRFWDGEEEGGDAAEGTYYYVLKFKEACAIEQQEVRMEKGYVTLVR